MTDILIITGLIILNGVFSLSETSVVSSRKARLKHKADEGHYAYRLAYDTARHPRAFLSTIQIGITLIGILAGALGGATLTDNLITWLSQFGLIAGYEETLAMAIIVVVTTFVSVVLGELVPKTVALQNPELLASLIVVPMRFLTLLFAPLVWMLTLATDLILRIFGLHQHEDVPVTEEEIQVLMSQGAEAGVFENSERDMVEGVLDLADERLTRMMTHRMDIISLPLDATAEATRHLLSHYSSFSYFPVCRGEVDDMAGVVVAKEILTDMAAGHRKPLKAYLHAPVFIPQSVSPLKVLEAFRKTKVKLAFVVDEYGGIAGLVTITDLYDYVFGEALLHQGGQIPQSIVQREDGSWMMEGGISAEEFFDYFSIKERPEMGHFSTLAGLVLILLGRVPKEGEEISWTGLRLCIKSMEGHRIALISARRLRSESPE